jgi:hypothetical protein
MQLTVDLELPRDLTASVPWGDDQRLFLVPIAVVSKEPRPSHVDVLNERGTRVQLFPREYNAKISAEALQRAVIALLDSDPATSGKKTRERVPTLKQMLSQLTTRDGLAAQFYAGFAVGQLKELLPNVDDTREGKYLSGLIEDLMASSMLWAPLTGTPGQLRSVRLDYHTTFNVSPIFLRPWRSFRRMRIPVELQHPSSFTVLRKLRQRPIDTNSRRTLRRLWNRLAHTVGFSAYELRLEKPYVQRTYSYHLEVTAPVGIDVRRVRFFGVVSWPQSEPGRVNSATTTTRGHLYFSNAERIGAGAMLIQLRVGARGLLFFSALTTALIAALLWLFAANARTTATNPEVTAQILLVAPALLIIFAFRQGEHALVARLLSGVRVLILASGVCAVAAAGADVGVRPFGEVAGAEWKSVGANWHYEAVVASGVAALLVIAWLSALTPMEAVRDGVRRACQVERRYAALAATLIVSQLVLALAMPSALSNRVASAIAIVALASLSGWIAGYGETTNSTLSRLPSTILTVSAVLSWAAGLVLYGLDAGAADWKSIQAPYELALGVLATVSILYAAIMQRAQEADAEHA